MSTLAINGGTPVFGGKQMMDLIPPWPPQYPETEEKLIEVYRSGLWGGCRQYEEKLMAEFAAFQDAKYSVWMANGTVTLECIDPKRIEEALTPRTRAIIPVHLFSAVADMDAIMAIARKHDLVVIEDCAHAHGARQHGKGVGSLGEIGSFSFQLSKLITGGEGGCCTTDSERFSDKLFRNSHIGNSRLFPKEPLEKGFTCHQYRFTEFQAAVIYDQLQHARELHENRKEGMKKVSALLKDTPGIFQQKSSFEDDDRAYYFPTFLLKENALREGVTRADIFAALRAEGALFHEGWGAPLYNFPSWNVPEKDFIKHDTPVCDDVMYNKALISHNAWLLADDAIISKIAEALDKVMNYYAR